MHQRVYPNKIIEDKEKGEVMQSFIDEKERIVKTKENKNKRVDSIDGV